MEDEPAIGMHRLHDLAHRAERGDDDRHAPRDRHGEIRLHARIAPVHDEIDAERRRIRRQPPGDLVEPGGIALGRALVQRGEGADHAAPAGLDDEIGAGDEEHRRRDRGQREPVPKGGRDRHHTIS